MESIRAFVGHSFRPEDDGMVSTILALLKRVEQLHPGFTWEHAQEPEPKSIDDKVLRLFEGKNLFIGICTASELVVSEAKLSRSRIRRSRFVGEASEFVRKTSDWVIQEIGIAIGRGMDVILLVEEDVRRPGSIQGNLEYVPFNRMNPERCFDNLLGMIVALSPKKEAHVTGMEGTEISAAAPPEPDASGVAQPSPEEDLKFALFEALFENNEEEVRVVNERFMRSEAARSDIERRKWSANLEYWRVTMGRDGDAQELKRLAEESPPIAAIWSQLGSVYGRYDDSASAAMAYESAAAAATEIRERVVALGRAAVAHHKAGDETAASRVRAAMNDLSTETATIEQELLLFELNWAEATRNDQNCLAAMERLLQLNPTDNDRRFKLAYKYSEMEMHRLAALHYTNIPPSTRDAVGWNNLGVAWNKLSLASLAVSAFRKAEELGETLAMSNLADRFLEAGLVPEAKAILNRALGLPEPNRRVASVLSRAEEIMAEEERKQEAMLEQAKEVSHFMREFGQALCRESRVEFVKNWNGPDCELTMKQNGDHVTLLGSYEGSGGLLGTLTLGDVLSQPENMRYIIEYTLTIRGASLVGKVKRRRAEQRGGVPSLFSGLDPSESDVLLWIDKDGKNMHALERPAGTEPREYALKANC